MTTCPTGKVCHPTVESADRQASHLAHGRLLHGVRIRHYHCAICGTWHLTLRRPKRRRHRLVRLEA